MKSLAAVFISVWLGVHLGFGYVVAPIMFGYDGMDKMVAGQIMGGLFHVSNYVGLVAWLWAWFALGHQVSGWHHGHIHKHTPKWIILLLILLSVNEFAVTPTLAALKAGQMPMLATLFASSTPFKLWHAISSSIHLLASVIGLILVIKLLNLERSVTGSY